MKHAFQVMIQRSGFKLLRLYWLIFKPVTLGVKILCINNRREVLLVKHSYVSGWHLPGGGVDRGESTRQCAARELFEECGVICSPSLLSMQGVFHNNSEYKNDHVVLYRLDGDFSIDNWSPNGEILECKYFPASNLPDGVSAATVRRVDEVLGNAQISSEW